MDGKRELRKSMLMAHPDDDDDDDDDDDVTKNIDILVCL